LTVCGKRILGLRVLSVGKLNPILFNFEDFNAPIVELFASNTAPDPLVLLTVVIPGSE